MWNKFTIATLYVTIGLFGCTETSKPIEDGNIGAAQSFTQMTAVAKPADIPDRLLQEVPDSVVHIELKWPDNSQSLGTGVYIGKGRVLTANHVMTDRFGRRPMKVRVLFGGRSTRPIYDAAEGFHQVNWRYIPDIDVCLIRGLNIPDWSKPARIATTLPLPGDNVFSIGLPRAGSARISVGQFESLAEDSVTMSLRLRDWFGDSGGPVYDSSGSLIGIVVANNVIPKITWSARYTGYSWAVQHGATQEEGTLAVNVTRLDIDELSRK